MIEFLKRRWIVPALIVLAAIAGFYAWKEFAPDGLPEGIASGNGRIEATEIDIANRIAGRVESIEVSEGEFVQPGQLLAVMDTRQLAAQRREADAQLQRAQISIETAQSLVRQREAERTAALAVVEQRKAEYNAAAAKLSRSEALAKTDYVSRQVLDDDRAQAESAKAAIGAAEAQLAATEAAIGAAKSQVVDARAAVDAAKATIERIDADISDSSLVSPRAGRVQYRIAEPGEVLADGGRVLNLVDLGDAYMTFFLPTEQAGRVALGSEVRIVLDAVPQYVIPAKVSFVADVAQFTPKTVETAEERLKLMFRVRARISPEVLEKYIQHVKTGLPGMAYVKLDPAVEWPSNLDTNILQ